MDHSDEALQPVNPDHNSIPLRLNAKGPAPRSVAERFWAKVLKTESCWLWQGGRDHNGYGEMTVGSQVDGSRRRANVCRIAWEIQFGAIPVGLSVLHNCPDGDNPLCVNAAHLWLGTQAENMADMLAKGRKAIGSAHGHARLTEDTVREMRRLWETGTVRKKKDLALLFHVTQSTVGAALRRRTWQHV